MSHVHYIKNVNPEAAKDANERALKWLTALNKAYDALHNACVEDEDAQTTE